MIFCHRYHEYIIALHYIHCCPRICSKCLTNILPYYTKPRFGPNLFIAPCVDEHFQPLQQRSLDTGMLQLSANERKIIILRRLPDEHTKNAVEEWSTMLRSSNNSQAKCIIEHWDRCHYYPTIITLKQNQFIHLNKGRLFSCQRINNTVNSVEADFSLSWQWMFTGLSAEGINREISTLLVLNDSKQKNNYNFRKKFSDAPIELSLLKMAEKLCASTNSRATDEEMLIEKNFASEHTIKVRSFK